MKLTAKEVKLLSALSNRQVRRKRDAWLSFLLTISLLVVTYGFGMFPLLKEQPFLAMASGATLSYLIHVYFGARP